MDPKTPKPASGLQQRAKTLDLAHGAWVAAKTSQRAPESQESTLWEAVKKFSESVCESKIGFVDDDVVQEALVDIWRTIGSFQSKSKFSTWAYRIAFRRCQDKLRGYQEERNRGLIPLDDIKSVFEDESSVRLEHGGGEIIANALKKLDKKKQQVVQLRLEGLSYEEIAEKLDISEGVAQKRWERALEELRDAA